MHRSVNELLTEFNEYAKPIAAQRQFIAQTKRLGVTTFNSFFRENKTIFADAPQNLIPVVLNSYSSNTHSGVVTEIKDFVDEFESVLTAGV